MRSLDRTTVVLASELPLEFEPSPAGVAAHDAAQACPRLWLAEEGAQHQQLQQEQQLELVEVLEMKATAESSACRSCTGASRVAALGGQAGQEAGVQ